MTAALAADDSRPVWGEPRGPASGLILMAMALKNGGQNRAALAALAPAPGDSVLELGCGPGVALVETLARVGPTGFVAGVDPSSASVLASSRRVRQAVAAGRAVVLRAGAADLPFRDGLFDRAYAVNSYQFWPDPDRAISELARVLRPGGRLAITLRGSNPERPTKFAGAAQGAARLARAAALFKARGWRLVDERADHDGARLMALTLLVESPA
jgi:ubiquinone/menaquinone biosynthesis C-methylase UbiE